MIKLPSQFDGFNTYPILLSAWSSGRFISLLVKNSGMAALMVKYISSFFLHFSNEKLQPLKKVIRRVSSGKTFFRICHIEQNDFDLPQVSGRWGCFKSHSLICLRSLSLVLISSFSSFLMLIWSSGLGWTRVILVWRSNNIIISDKWVSLWFHSKFIWYLYSVESTHETNSDWIDSVLNNIL